jgi:hypothetical protein
VGKCRVADSLSTFESCSTSAALSRFTLHFCSVFLTLVITCGVPGAFAAKKEKKVTPPPAPPPAMPQKVKVLRNSTIDISLRIYGRKNQSITYVIRRKPSGKLTPPKNTELEVAIVQYTPPPDRTISADSFEFAARSDLGVSAPASVEIEIVDIPAEIIAPVEVSFGPVLTGSMDKQTIEIENQGGAVAEGDLFINAPWRVEVSPHYRLEPGQRRTVAITFAPDKPGDFTTDLRFSSQPERVTTLRGKALGALEARPKSLKLEPVTGALIRAAGLEVVNHTAEPLTVEISGSKRITTDGPLSLAPGQSGTLMVRTSKDDVRPLNTELVLESGIHRTVVPVESAGLPGVLQAEVAKVELKPSSPGSAPVGDFLVRNLGGDSASADLLIDPEFKLSTNKLSLPAGGEARVDVRLTDGVNPPIEGSIELKSGGHAQRITLAAVGPTVASTPPGKSANSRAAKKKEPAEREAISRVTEWSPHETDPNSPIDPVNIVRTVEMQSTSCTLEWHVDRSSATKFIAETRELKIESGQLAKHWHRYPAFRVERAGNHYRGTIEQLQPSRMYNIRVQGLDKSGKPVATIFEASLTTRPAETKGTRKTWTALLIGLVIAGIGYFWFRRLRAATDTPPFNPAKTQKIY